MNYYVQGSCYDLLAEALLEIHQQGLGDAVFVAVHDELVVATEAAGDIERIMLTPPEDFSPRPVGCRCSGSAGWTWATTGRRSHEAVPDLLRDREQRTSGSRRSPRTRHGRATRWCRCGRAARCPTCARSRTRELKETGEHECGVHHAITDPVVAGRVFERLGRSFDQPLNLGVVAWPSRLIVVDADHEASCQAFLADWATAEHDDGYLAHSPDGADPRRTDRRR